MSKTNLELYVSSDIHGHLHKFKSALIQAGLLSLGGHWINQNAQLVLCGDYIDRGPDSIGVLTFINQLVDNGANIICLWGNHEKMMLEASKRMNSASMWTVNGGIACLKSWKKKDSFTYGEIQEFSKLKVVQEFLKRLVHFHFDEETKTFFVHGGLNPYKNLEDFLALNKDANQDHLWTRVQSMVSASTTNPDWIRGNYSANRLIVGHTPVAYLTKDYETLMEPLQLLGGRLLCVDTGSYYENGCVTITRLYKDSHRVVGTGIYDC